MSFRFKNALSGLLLTLLMLSACGQESSKSLPVNPYRIPASALWQISQLSEGWTYRFGSSPHLPNGEWAWAQPDFEDGSWRGMAHPGSDLIGNGQREMWVRIRLSEAGLAHPLVFLKLAGNVQEAYADGKRLPLQALSDHFFEIMPSHEKHFLLHPSVHDGGQVLTLHLGTSGPRMGVYLPAYLGEEIAVGFALMRAALPQLAIAALTAFLCIVSLALFLATRKDSALLYFSLLCLASSIYAFSISNLAGILISHRSPTYSLLRFAAPALYIAIYSFILRVFGEKFLQWVKWVRVIMLIYIIAHMVAFYKGHSLEYIVVPMNIFMLASLAGLTLVAILRAREGDLDSRTMCAGGALALVPILIHSLPFIGLTNFRPWPGLSVLSLIIFLSTLGVILIRRFMEVHRQRETYSEMLGAQVQVLERRNTEIQALNDELRRQIEQRSDRMIDLLMRSRSGDKLGPLQVLAAGYVLCGHYRVIKALGQGAMGSVYEVERISDGLHLAAKLLSGKSDRTSMIRFIREARILAQLQHPNLVSVMDIDITEEGALFLVMELVRGTTLKDAKRRYRELEFAISVLRQVCMGLQAIHAQGIVHRDLKPANILLAETDSGLVAKIADFGISTTAAGLSTSQAQAGPPTKAEESQSKPSDAAGAAAAPTPERPQAEADAEMPTAEAISESPSPALSATDPGGDHLTQTGVLIGTPVYMAPELSSGSRNAPPASDIFSLGVIAFELLTGRLPFSEPPVIAIWEKRAVAAARLRGQRDDLPAELASVLDRCLGPDPAGRPTLPELLSTISTAFPQ